MAGGTATRFGRAVEKAMLEVGGVPLLQRSIAALDAEGIEDISVAVTKRTPATAEAARDLGIEVICTAGDGYHSDILEVLGRVGRFFSLNVDVPFARNEHVTLLIREGGSRSVAGVVSAELALCRTDPESLLEGPDGAKMIWAGLNIVSDDPETGLVEIADGLLCVNINDDEDLAFANRLADERGL
jgi:adenosylcobinamide-phosphate guanylyltransferase